MHSCTSFDKWSGCKNRYSKRGTAAFADADNKKKIIEYVCFKIDFNFIPAVRTEYDALRVVDSLIEKSLETLDTNPDYINAMNKIEELQQGILDGISNQIIEPLQEFYRLSEMCRYIFRMKDGVLLCVVIQKLL